MLVWMCSSELSCWLSGAQEMETSCLERMRVLPVADTLFRISTWLKLVHKGWVSSQEVGQGDKCLEGGVPALAAGGVVHAVGEVVAIVAAARGVAEGAVRDQGVLDTGHPRH